jgi:thiol-disulfide isomerase/thioredoxin
MDPGPNSAPADSMNMSLPDACPCPFPRRRFLRIAAAGCAVSVAAPMAWAAGLQPGDALPDLKSLQLEGTLPDLAGKVVHLDFWASWCVPCRQSFPVLETLHKTYGSKGYVLIGVSMDEKRTDMERFLKKNPVSFATVRDAQEKLASKVRPPGMPTSYFFGADGRLDSVHPKYEGEPTRKKYVEIVERLLLSVKA